MYQTDTERSGKVNAIGGAPTLEPTHTHAHARDAG